VGLGALIAGKASNSALVIAADNEESRGFFRSQTIHFVPL